MLESEATSRLQDLVRQLAVERAALHDAFLPKPNDDAATALKRQRLLLTKLGQWGDDPLLFIAENAWVPDPRNLFGSESLPQGLSPKSMVPLLLSPKLEEFIRTVDTHYESGQQVDVFTDKPRQYAATSGLCWWLLQKWLFRKSFAFVLGSGKGKEEIDAGGKGVRDATSLFGRKRLFLDAFMWNVSVVEPDGVRVSLLRFNQHEKPSPGYKGRNRKALEAWRRNLTGLSDSDDAAMRLSRPRWIVHGHEMFERAEGNWIRGDIPGPGFARSYSASGAGVDEFPHCNLEYGAGTDESTLAACAVNTRFRIFLGTWPERIATSTAMYRRMRDGGEATVVVHLHWTDVPVYLFGAHWTCPECGHANEWPHKESTGHEGVDKACGGCRKTTRVTRFLVTSPWFRKASAKCGSKIAVASEILNDPAGTSADRLFVPWSASSGVRPLKLPPRGQYGVADGFDPGTSVWNPACWIAAVIDTRELRGQIVGYWMAPESFIQWWVPFLKRWSPKQLERMRPIYGLRSDQRTWMQAFSYPPGALEMLERISRRFSLEESGAQMFPKGLIGGDRYGDIRNMAESPYEQLREYGIEVHSPRTTDRSALVRQAVEWSSRFTIWDEIADIRPPGCPTLREVFEGAKAKPHTAQSDYKYDVDRQEPKDAIHAVDAFAYMIRVLDERAHAVATADGTFEQSGEGSSEPWSYGGGSDIGL